MLRRASRYENSEAARVEGQIRCAWLIFKTLLQSMAARPRDPTGRTMASARPLYLEYREATSVLKLPLFGLADEAPPSADAGATPEPHHLFMDLARRVRSAENAEISSSATQSAVDLSSPHRRAV